MIRKLALSLAAPLLALAFVYPVHAADVPNAVCTIDTIGQNPSVTVLDVNGTGYTPGHTYYARVGEPAGQAEAQVLYQSFQGEFFFQDENLDGNLPAGTYTIAIYQSIAAYHAHKGAIAACSAVAS